MFEQDEEGEARNLHWADIDFVNNTVVVTPEKGSEPRIFKLSDTLIAMLKAIKGDTKSKRVFGKWLKSQRRLFHNFRRRVAGKLKNPRILSITYRTFRHWKATTLYHQTKDILYVMRFLGSQEHQEHSGVCPARGSDIREGRRPVHQQGSHHSRRCPKAGRGRIRVRLRRQRRQGLQEAEIESKWATMT